MAFLGLFVFFCLLIRPQWYPTPDSSAYLSMARSVANGEGLQRFGSELLWYPPGYAVLISPLFTISDRPFLGIAFLHLAMAMLCAYGVYLWAKRLTPDAAVVLTLLAVTNVLFCIHFRRTLSELPFTSGLIWSVNLLNFLNERIARGSSWLLYLGAGVFLGGVCFIRHAGLMMAAGFAWAMFLTERAGHVSRLRGLAYVLLVGLPATMAVATLMFNEERAASDLEGRTYLDNFAENERHWTLEGIEGLRMQIGAVARVVVPGMFKVYSDSRNWLHLTTLFYLSVFAVICVGWIRLARGKPDVLVLAAPFYLLLHSAYAMEAGARFMVPMAPLIVVCLYVGFQGFSARRDAFAVLLAIHVVVTLAYITLTDVPRAAEWSAYWGQVEELAEEIPANETVVVSPEFPEHVRLMLQYTLDRKVKRVQSPTNELPVGTTLLESFP